MTNCENCRVAEERPWHGITKGCATCEIREIARAPTTARETRLAAFGLAHGPTAQEELTELVRQEWARLRRQARESQKRETI